MYNYISSAFILNQTSTQLFVSYLCLKYVTTARAAIIRSESDPFQF